MSGQGEMVHAAQRVLLRRARLARWKSHQQERQEEGEGFEMWARHGPSGAGKDGERDRFFDMLLRHVLRGHGGL